MCRQAERGGFALHPSFDMGALPPCPRSRLFLKKGSCESPKTSSLKKQRGFVARALLILAFLLLQPEEGGADDRAELGVVGDQEGYVKGRPEADNRVADRNKRGEVAGEHDFI
jgi:hypothetical protein